MQTVQSEITTALRKLILTYQLRPGERLVQDDLATQLNVSRTPVREAIRQLETEGLVSILPYKGATVSIVTAQEIEEVYQVRIALESYASRLTMQAITEPEIDALANIVKQMRDAVELHDPEISLKINRDFYVYFYGIAKQKKLFDLVMLHLDLSRRFRRQHFYSVDLSRATLENHEQFIEFIKQQNEDLVERHVRQGLRQALKDLLKIINKQTIPMTFREEVA